METTGIIAAGLFGLGYLLITMEQKFGTHKSAIALTLGGVLWLLTALHLKSDRHHLDEALHSTGAEIFNVIAFLLAALALIEILVHYRLFDLIRAKMIKLKINDKQEFLVMMTMTFFLSAVLDNIAITVAMLQIARRFFTGRNMIIAAAGIVVAANAGGSWSPIGDVTTVLLWLADKFTALEVIKFTFLPAFTLFVVAIALMYTKLDNTSFMKREKDDIKKLTKGEKAVIGTAMASFSLPLAMSFVGLPPYMGLLFGLGITWGLIEMAKKYSKHQNSSHMTANIDRLIQAVDISSVKYIMGILLAVLALANLGVLQWLSNSIVGPAPTNELLIGVGVGMGFLSGIVDNASLVAIAINSLPITDPELWSLIALTAGNGGSFMVIASAAGVVAMGSYKQLNVTNYLKVASLPVLIAFLASIAIWIAQYYLL